MRRIVYVLIVIALGVFLFSSRNTSTIGRAQTNPVRIGVINSTTGLFADQGKLVENGILLARDEINAKGGINGRNIELLIENDASNTGRAVKAFHKLAAAKVDMIIGPLSSGAAAATAALADRYDIPQVVPTAHSTKLRGISRNSFLIYPNQDDEARFIAGVATERLKKKRVAVFMPANSFSDQFTNALTRYVKEGGGTIVDNRRFKESTTNFRADVARIARTKPDVIVFPSFLPVAPVAITRELAAQNVSIIAVVKGAACALALQGLNELVLPAEFRENIFFVNETLDQRGSVPMQEFLASYQKRFNEAAQPYAAMGSAAVYVAKDAIEKGTGQPAVGPGQRGRLRTALSRAEVETAFGRVKFDQNQVNTGAGFSLYKLDVGRVGKGRGELVPVQ